MERLTIENYAGIKRLDLEVRPFTVLIGPQSVGKSITAKLLYFFKSLPREAFLAAGKEQPPDLHQFAIERLAKLLPDPSQGGTKSAITYTTGKEKLRLIRSINGTSGWKIQLPDRFQTAYTEFKESWQEAQGIEAETPGSLHQSKTRGIREDAEKKYWNEVTKVFPFPNLAIFVPAGRSYYVQVERDFAFFFQNANVDPFISQFATTISHLRDLSEIVSVVKQRDPSFEKAKQLFETLMGGHYLRQNQMDLIDHKDGRILPAKLWSSGQQEAHILAFLLLSCCYGYRRNSKLYIEEPEAHLFPGAQKTMTELIALAFNSGRKGIHVFLTTHSPYILTSINNLLLAGQQYKNEASAQRKKSLEKIVPQAIALNPEDIGAYYMTRDGCHSIIDKQSGLIDASGIDDASVDISKQFEDLLELEAR